MSYYAKLADRAVLAAEGEDIRDFLQGLITNDIRKVNPQQAIFAALLSPQGRFLYDFFISEYQGKLLIETDKARLPELKKRLMMYKLRSRVMFTDMPQMKVAAIWENAEGGNLESKDWIIYDDPRLLELGKRLIYSGALVATDADAQESDYENMRLSLGVPEGSKDLIQDKSILLEYKYDALHAIDFTKGCYVGQEVTARSKHRATLHKSIYCVKAKTVLPPSGTVIMAGEREVGVMASVAGEHGLALLRIDEVNRALESNTPFVASQVALLASEPLWYNPARTAHTLQ